jgi:IPT/TIG domain-containing protein
VERECAGDQFVSASALKATVPKAMLTTAGTAQITVTNPTPRGGTSAAASFTIVAPQNPVPAITALSPARVIAGGAAFTLTVTGTGFVADSTVDVNGAGRTTTFISGTQLQASINATEIATAGNLTIAVSNPSPGGDVSNSVSLPIRTSTTVLNLLNLQGSGLVWDKSHSLLYVSVPVEAKHYGNSITAVDPVAGKVVGSQASGKKPHVLAISDDDQYLYATLEVDASIQRFKLPGLARDIQFQMGTDPVLGGQYSPEDVEVQPGHAHTVAVAEVSAASQAFQQIAVYDDAVARGTVGTAPGFTMSPLLWVAARSMPVSFTRWE